MDVKEKNNTEKTNAAAEPVDGVFTLRMTTSGMLSLKSFKFS